MTTHRLARGCLAAVAVAWGATGPAALAQRNASGLPAPRLFQVAPPGAKAGTSVDVVVAGRHLEEPERLVFSHPGIRAEFVPPPAPVIDPKTKKPKPAANALPADHYRFKVTVPADVPLGLHDVRLVNRWGVSNPRAFAVGDLNETAEKEPNNDVDQAQKVELNTTINGTIQSPTDVDYYAFRAAKGQRVVVSCLASSIDSRLQPQVEVYDRGDRQLASNRAYAGYDALADFTAPEDDEYQVRVFQFTHNFRQPIPGNMPPGSSDYFYRLSITTAPWIDAVMPSVVEPGKAATVTVFGRNLPGGALDQSAVADDVVLEKATVTVTAPVDGRGKLAYPGFVGPARGWQDGFELRLRNASGSSNPFLVGLARAPVVRDAGGNDTPEKAQPVALPCEIAGQVSKRRDRDWFSFAAKRGESWNFEVVSNRLGAPTYMTMLLRDAAGKSELYESPLNENMNLLPRKFFSRSEDPPAYRFTAPADGTYQLLVASRAGDTLFGARHTYAVRILRDEPDFRLVALSASSESPDAPTVPAGGHQAFTVIANRSGGFAGDVELSVEGLPAGVICPRQVLGGSVRKTTLVLTAAPGTAPWAGEVRIKGTAMVNGATLVREARPASIVWPMQPNTNSPALSRLDRAQWLAVRGQAPFTLTPSLAKADRAPALLAAGVVGGRSISVLTSVVAVGCAVAARPSGKDTDEPAELLQGDRGTLKLKVQRLWPEVKAPIQVSLMQPQNRPGAELPVNLRFNNNQPLVANPGQAEVSLPVTVGSDVPPGVYNVVFRGQTQVPYNKDPKAKARPNTVVAQPSAPLVLSVAPRTLAQLSLSANAANVRPGGQAVVVVRVQRRFGYQGEFKVRLVLPKGDGGIFADEVTLPAGKDEVQFPVRASVQATPGRSASVLVRATALWNGRTPTVHEARLNVNVVK
jgi:hypothetical protein